MLRHLAFFEELAKTKETDANWRSTSAGLVVLRLIDQWMAAGSGEGEGWGLSAVRDAVNAIEETTPVRRILASVVDAIAESKPGDVSAVIPRLMAYAKSLEYDSRWTLAADVYSTILPYADPVVDADVVITAHVQSSTCLRFAGDFDGALAASHRAQEFAAAIDDVAGQLRGQIVEARVSISRGNFPVAASVLDSVIDAAERQHLSEVESRALHERAAVAGMTGDLEKAIRLMHAALPLAASQRDRDRILADIATGFLELGLLDIAGEAYVILIATAQDRSVRLGSIMNMMDIASRQRAEPVFDRYRRELATVEFPPYMHAKFLITLGNGYKRFANQDLAVSNLEEAIQYSRAKGLNHLLFEAEEALAAARSEALTPTPETAELVPEGIAVVAEAIRAMKETVGTGA